MSRRAVVRYDEQDTATAGDDEVAVEEPLEIRLAGDPFAVTMRTPGQDQTLALGLLFSEGVIQSRDDVGSALHCGRLGDQDFGNVLDVLPAPGTAFDVDASDVQRWGTLRTAACGVCGRRTIEDLLARMPQVAKDTRTQPAREILRSCLEQLSALQPGFVRTGGMHAAAIFDGQGTLLSSAEDVGRHNAVDKAVGALLLEGYNLNVRERVAGAMPPPAVLVVSGRVSFEIVQKAAMAGVAAVCSISAPSSLAIDLAHSAGIFLAAFVRDGRMSVY